MAPSAYRGLSVSDPLFRAAASSLVLKCMLRNAQATNSEGKTECYWGFDHLGMVADHLGLKKLQPESDAERGWKAML